ncbi:MAG: hypothetical protein IMY77_02905 [Chloroflexi bacterium]|nr:hypothetical protein [Chloroflexota bacterium]
MFWRKKKEKEVVPMPTEFINKRIGELIVLPCLGTLSFCKGAGAKQLKCGWWRAYYLKENITPGGHYSRAPKVECAKDDITGEFIEAPTLRELVDILKMNPLLSCLPEQLKAWKKQGWI